MTYRGFLFIRYSLNNKKQPIIKLYGLGSDKKKRTAGKQ